MPVEINSIKINLTNLSNYGCAEDIIIGNPDVISANCSYYSQFSSNFIIASVITLFLLFLLTDYLYNTPWFDAFDRFLKILTIVFVYSYAFMYFYLEQIITYLAILLSFSTLILIILTYNIIQNIKESRKGIESKLKNEK